MLSKDNNYYNISHSLEQSGRELDRNSAMLRSVSNPVMLFLIIFIVYIVTLLLIFSIHFIIYEWYFHSKYNTVVKHNYLDIHVRPPTRRNGSKYKRITSSATRRAKAALKRGFDCSINGFYRYELYSSSDFADRNNGNFGI